MKTKTITQTGYLITGVARISLWGNSEGEVEMDKTFIPYSELTKRKLLNAINDGQFGCESIILAEVEVFIVYNNGSKEYDRTIQVTYPPHLLLATKGITV